MRFIKDAGVFLLMGAMVFAVVYMMVYAWDQEYEYQQQKEKEYYVKFQR